MATEYVEARIREGRLIVASPERVWNELREYSEQLAGHPLGGDTQLEESLLARADPLIDVGLGRYASDRKVVAALYTKTRQQSTDHLQKRYLHGLRLACLSNESLKTTFLPTPEDIVGKDELARLVSEGDDDELGALLANPISARLLTALYKGEGLFSSLDDGRRRKLVMLPIFNPRLNDDQSNEHGPDLTYWRMHEGIIGMLASAPTDLSWLYALRSLLDRLDPGTVESPDAPINAVLDRWKNVDVPENEKKAEREGYYTELSMHEEFRCLVAALYGKYYDKSDGKFTARIVGSLDATDVTLRCAQYGNAEMTEQAMKDGYARDGDVFTFAALCNESIYLKPQLRKVLEEDLLRGPLRYVYQRRCDQLHRRRKFFDPRPTATWLVEEEETQAQTKELALLKQLETGLAQMAKELSSIQTWLAWGFVILGVLVLVKGKWI